MICQTICSRWAYDDLCEKSVKFSDDLVRELDVMPLGYLVFYSWMQLLDDRETLAQQLHLAGHD